MKVHGIKAIAKGKGPRAGAFLFSVAIFLAGCGGGGGDSAAPNPPPPPPPPSVAAADISLLFMGNSHTSVNNVPGMVEALVRAARPGRSVVAVQAPGSMFLEDRAVHEASLQLLRERNWSFVVLQAQKYSASGQFVYSTDGAESLVRAARASQAVPILFPEWPRQDVVETHRIFELHVAIASRTPACVAPIGQAWDLARGRYPGLVLHAADGNHSAPAGALLAAMVLAATLTGISPDLYPDLPDLGVDVQVQARLRSVAAETVLATHPRQWCPGDP